MRTKEEAVLFIEKQFARGCYSKGKTIYSKDGEDIDAAHYGKCELYALLKFVYEDESFIKIKGDLNE